METDTHVQFGILGPFEVRAAGKALQLGGRRKKSLLAILLLNANRVVAPERLVDLLWEDDAPPTAMKALQVYVSQLRKMLRGATPRQLLATETDGYVLRVEPGEIDATRFERVVEENIDLPLNKFASEVSARLTAALALWRGDALEGIRDSAFVREEAVRLDELRLEALERRVDADLATGRQSDLIQELSKLTAHYPLRERFWAQLMMAQYGRGRQADALDTYRRCREILVEELGIEPGAELRSVHRSILAGEPSLTQSVTSSPPPRHNLPPYGDSFVGRDHATSQLSKLVKGSSLVTIMGPGGVGKTRLAVEMARRLSFEFPHGVFSVDLAAVSDPEIVPEAVAESVGIPAEADMDRTRALREYLRERATLVILDNCEHLVGACRILAKSILEGSRTKLLCTSRIPLDIEQEVVWELAPLLAPERTNTASLEQLHDYPSIQLFVERARAASSHFEPAASETRVLARICSQLDGIPLALELAAARCGVSSLEEISEGIDQRLDLVAPTANPQERRHRTLRAALEWSLDLIGEAERVLFRRMSVFLSTTSLDAIRAVCGSGLNGVDGLLEALVSNSLVVRERTGTGVRYRLLDTMRRLAEDESEEARETSDVAARHADYHRGLVARAASGLQGHDQAMWFERLGQEMADLRAAFAFFLSTNDTSAATEFLEGLWWYWYTRLGQASWWIQRLRSADIPNAADRARLDSVDSFICFLVGDFDAARACSRRALRESRNIGSTLELNTWHILGSLAMFDQQWDEARGAFEEVVRKAREAGSTWWEAQGTDSLGRLALTRGAFDSAEIDISRAAAIYSDLGDHLCHADSLWLIAILQRRRGDSAAARRTLKEAVRLRRPTGSHGALLCALGMLEVDEAHPRHAVALAQRGLAEIWELKPREVGALFPIEVMGAAACGAGDLDKAALFFGAASGMRERLPAARPPEVDELVREYEETVQEKLDGGILAAWMEGRAMTDEEILERAQNFVL